MPYIRSLPHKAREQLDTLARTQVHNFNPTFAQPLDPALKVHRLPDDQRTKPKLPHQPAAIPARRKRRDHNQIPIATLPSRTPKRIRLPMNRWVPLLHPPVPPRTQQRPIPAKDRRPNRHPSLFQPRSSLAQSDVQHRLRRNTHIPIHAKSINETATKRLRKGSFGGAERDRTADLLVANEALSQLSYSPTPKPGRTPPKRTAHPCATSVSLSRLLPRGSPSLLPATLVQNPLLGANGEPAAQPHRIQPKHERRTHAMTPQEQQMIDGLIEPHSRNAPGSVQPRPRGRAAHPATVLSGGNPDALYVLSRPCWCSSTACSRRSRRSMKRKQQNGTSPRDQTCRGRPRRPAGKEHGRQFFLSHIFGAAAAAPRVGMPSRSSSRDTTRIGAAYTNR